MAIADHPIEVASGENQSAVAWSAILVGAVTATAVSMMLLILGSAIGLSSTSPWADSGATAATVTKGAVVWLIIIQWVSSFFAGYLAGRLRTKWTGIHTDEAFFRDTAHGFAAWAVATLLTAFVAAYALTGLAGSAVRAAGGAASAIAQTGAQAGASLASSDMATSYVDRLFRSAKPASGDDAGTRAEVGRIFSTSLASGTLSDGDRAYLEQLVAARTGVSPEEARKRVEEVTAAAKSAADKAKAAADEARKASAKLSFYMFFSMLIGAFIASVAGAYGGRLRDA